MFSSQRNKTKKQNPGSKDLIALFTHQHEINYVWDWKNAMNLSLRIASTIKQFCIDCTPYTEIDQRQIYNLTGFRDMTCWASAMHNTHKLRSYYDRHFLVYVIAIKKIFFFLLLLRFRFSVPSHPLPCRVHWIIPYSVISCPTLY